MRMLSNLARNSRSRPEHDCKLINLPLTKSAYFFPPAESALYFAISLASFWHRSFCSKSGTSCACVLCNALLIWLCCTLNTSDFSVKSSWSFSFLGVYSWIYLSMLSESSWIFLSSKAYSSISRRKFILSNFSLNIYSLSSRILFCFLRRSIPISFNSSS